jgi:hypothetical protein
VEWKVDFYQEPDGAAPVESFLDSLSVERRAKALALIQELRRQGPALPFPYSSQVAGGFASYEPSMAKRRYAFFILATVGGVSSYCTAS